MADCDAAGADLPRGLDAVQNRHGQVHDDDVRLVLLRQRHRFAAVGGFRNHMKTFVAFEQHAEAFPDDRMVVRQKDSDRSHHVSTDVHRSRLSQGKRDPEQRALAARRFHDEPASERAHTLFHSDQAHAPFLRWIESPAIVLYRQQQSVRLLCDRDSHIPGARMLDDVVQRLLDDSIDARLVIFGEFLGDFLGGHLHPYPAPLGRLAGLPLQRRYQSEIVEHGRAQQQGHVAHHADRLFEQPS